MQDAPYKDCLICGRRFRKHPNYSQAQWTRARYCSVACTGRSKRAAPRKRTCERCGAEYLRPPTLADWQWNRRRFCSRRCLHLVDPVATPPLTHEVAWAAGLYEGEGTAGLFGKRVTTAVAILMTDLEPLERCRDALGLGYVEGPSRIREGWKPIYAWRISRAAEIVAFFDAVWPFISERRKEQARPLVAHCKERISPYG